jgi:hypothetical protein
MLERKAPKPAQCGALEFCRRSEAFALAKVFTRLSGKKLSQQKRNGVRQNEVSEAGLIMGQGTALRNVTVTLLCSVR